MKPVAGLLPALLLASNVDANIHAKVNSKNEKTYEQQRQLDDAGPFDFLVTAAQDLFVGGSTTLLCDIIPIPGFIADSLLQCPDDTPSPSVSMQPSDSPSSPPSQEALWDQVGGSVEGITVNDSLGMTVTMDEFGETAVITGKNIVLIYKLFYDDDRIRSWEIGRDLSTFIDGPLITASLSNDGLSLAIGDPESPTTTEGEVVIFNNDPDGDAGWAELVRVPGNTAGEKFGSHLSISNDGERTAATAPGSYIRIFDLRPNSYWYLEIVAPDPADKAFFAKSVAISGDGLLMAVGEYGNTANSGFVHLYELTSFGIVSSLSGSNIGDSFGHSIAMSNDAGYIAVGTLDNNYVKVYKRDGTKFTQVGTDLVDTIEPTGLLVGFGTSLSMSFTGTRLIIGVPSKTFYSVTSSGAAYLYNVSPSSVNLIAAFGGEAANDKSGETVAVSGDGMRVSSSSVLIGGGKGGVRMFEKYN